MVVQLFICLIAIAAASLLITQGRRRRIWSVLVLSGLCIISYFFMDSLNASSSGFIYQWLPYEVLKADINISSSSHMRQMFFPLICLLAAQVYLNTVFASEYHSLHINTLMLLNFVSMILLASSHDFLQLMFASSMFSVIGFYMPDQIQPKKKVFIFNFLADMAVFMALAIVYAATSSISLKSLPQYSDLGSHKDLVACLLLFAVGSKCGLFLFNGHYFSLKEISFNRISGIMMFSVPLSGLILAAKLYPLFQASPIPGNILPWWCLLSVLSAVIGALINLNLKSKVISLFLLSYAYMLLKISGDSTEIYFFVPQILSINFLTSVIFIMASITASEENNIGYLGGFWRYGSLNLLTSLVIITAISATFLPLAKDIGSNIFALIYIGILCFNMRLIYLGKTRADEKVLAFAKSVGPLYWLPLVAFGVFMFWQGRSWQYFEFYVFMGFGLLVFLAFPTLWAIKFGQLPLWQSDILSWIYERLIIIPLQFLGRILWLVFDVVVIEHNIIGSVSENSSKTIAGLHQLQEAQTKNYILSILSGLIVIMLYLGYYIYE